MVKQLAITTASSLPVVWKVNSYSTALLIPLAPMYWPTALQLGEEEDLYYSAVCQVGEEDNLYYSVVYQVRQILRRFPNESTLSGRRVSREHGLLFFDLW